MSRTDLAALARKHNIEVWRDSVQTLECPQCNEEITTYGAYVDANSRRAELDGALVVVCPECGCNCPSPKASGTTWWFYWTCAPGCLPDSAASGPFETEREALATATEGLDDE
jgi:hypothetical protein